MVPEVLEAALPLAAGAEPALPQAARDRVIAQASISESIFFISKSSSIRDVSAIKAFLSNCKIV